MGWHDWVAVISERAELGLVTALIASFVLYFVFRKTSELGRHAAQNTSATIILCFMNLAVSILFLDELNAGAQAAYSTLGIPTIPADTWDSLPYWAVCLIAIATRDFADYWNHRLMHTRWIWPVHAAHHSDTHVNAFTAYRVHFLETVVMAASYIVLLTWLQMPQALPVVVIFSILHSQYVHMNLEIDHGPFKYLIASPAFHRWHHADVKEAHGKNLANVMPIYDRMFGTYYNPHLCDAEMGALSSGIADKNPFLIFAYPFQAWARMVRRGWANRKAKPERPSQPVETTGMGG